MVIRTPYGGGIRGGLYHSQSGEAYFCHTPGLKVVIPSTPHDAKGLLLASIDDPDPVLFLEPKALYRQVKGEVPEGKYKVDLSTLRTVREAGTSPCSATARWCPCASARRSRRRRRASRR